MIIFFVFKFVIKRVTFISSIKLGYKYEEISDSHQYYWLLVRLIEKLVFSSVTGVWQLSGLSCEIRLQDMRR